MTLPAQNFACIEKAVRNRACALAQTAHGRELVQMRDLRKQCLFCGHKPGLNEMGYRIWTSTVCADCAQIALAADVMENAE